MIFVFNKINLSSVSLYNAFALLSECHKWSAGAHLRLLGPWAMARGCFRSECCAGGESMAAPRVKPFLAPINQRRIQGWTGRKYHFSSLRQ